ncbi:MAG TPA: PfkB family carbohydrate kinase [Acidothermaceae bacterium]
MTVLIVGDVIDDIVVRPSSPTVVDSDTVSHITRSPGGSGANQAAWLGSLGTPVRFVGRVGRADVERHHAALTSFGVQPILIPDDEAPTGAIVIVLGERGERNMYTDRGANARLSAADLPLSVLDDIELLHVNGYALFSEDARQAMLRLIAESRRRGVQITVDPCSAAFLPEAARFLDWTEGAAVCFPNLDEAAVLTGRADADAAARALAAHYPIVVLKLGARGVVVARRGETPVRLAAHTSDVKDTTGAGDALCAGFLAARLRGQDPIEAAAAGLRAAAAAVSIAGGRPSA